MIKAVPVTIATIMAKAMSSLRAAGVDQPRMDARLLLQQASGLSREAMICDAEAALTGAALAEFSRLIARRCRREPVSQLLGQREFWSLPFKISRAVLDPRPDSETLVAAMLAQLPDRSAELTVLDLGTGSGCLLLAVLSELPNARGVGVDISAAAIAIAEANATSLGLDRRAAFVVGDWASALTGPFDWVIANPPYVADEELVGLSSEVRCYEPRLALAGGADGLAAYRRVLPDVKRLIDPGGCLGLEVGHGQIAVVRGLLEDCGMACHQVYRDLSGTERCVLAKPLTEI